MQDLYQVNYTDPTLGLDPSLPDFESSIDEKLIIPNASDIVSRKKDMVELCETVSLPFTLLVRADNKVYCPYHMLHHSTLKSHLEITGRYDPKRHGDYIFRDLCHLISHQMMSKSKSHIMLKLLIEFRFPLGPISNRIGIC